MLFQEVNMLRISSPGYEVIISLKLLVQTGPL